MRKKIIKTLEEIGFFDDPDIYEPKGRLKLLENNELSDWEEAFMQGYEEAS